MGEVFVPAEDVWQYMLEHEEELSTQAHEIARNSELGFSVYVSKNDEEFCVCVSEDSEEFMCESPFDSYDCEDFVQWLYDQYIRVRISDVAEEFENFDLNIDDAIHERETELFEATQDFLDVACGQKFFDEQVLEIEDHFLDYLSKEYGARIYRPTIFDDDDDGFVVEDFPYEYEEDEEDYEDFEFYEDEEDL